MFKINKFDFLVSFYIFSIMVSELLGAKTFPLFEIGNFNLSASVAIFVIPFLFSINDIITEVYGKERARSVIRAGLVMIALVMLFSLLAIHLPPSSRFEGTESAYDTVFGKSIRISAASLIAFATAEFLDVYIFSKIREKLGKSKLWLRNNASNFISQLVDTTLFITLAFYALDKSFVNNADFLIGLIVPYWLLKCSISVIGTPLVYAGVKWLRKDLSTKTKKS